MASVRDGAAARWKVWTEEDIRILKENYSGMADAGLMVLLPGRTREEVDAMARRLGLCGTAEE